MSAQAQKAELDVRPLSGTVATSLQPRQFSAVAHDSVHHQFLLFGGTYGAQRFSDTWLLNTSGWKQLDPRTSPSARISSSSAYDTARAEYVLFGGRVKQAKPEMCSSGIVPQHLKNEFFCGDTWVFTGGGWIRKDPALSPPAREGHAMAFDAAHSQVVLFGGIAGSNSALLNDTWIWNGIFWKKANPAHTPPARLWHSMAYDPARRQVVLFGGDGGTQFLQDTWLWNGTDWQAGRPQPSGPAPRTNAALDYVPGIGQLVLFSGTTWNSRRNGSLASDCWTWDGEQWKLMATGNFELVTNFSRKLTAAQLSDAIVANGTPSLLWLPVK